MARIECLTPAGEFGTLWLRGAWDAGWLPRYEFGHKFGTRYGPNVVDQHRRGRLRRSHPQGREAT